MMNFSRTSGKQFIFKKNISCIRRRPYDDRVTMVRQRRLQPGLEGWTSVTWPAVKPGTPVIYVCFGVNLLFDQMLKFAVG